MSPFLTAALSLFFLLFLSIGIFLLSKKIRFPYTVLLVGFGSLVGYLATYTIPAFSFFDDFPLTPDILLYVFLPILLFESAYNIRFRDLLDNIRSISLLAIVSLLVSSVAVGSGLYFLFPFLGYEIPFSVAFLFGAAISATDPVAVLALFKELGAPKRLTLIFEGESLFNDGTAVALFLVILGVVIQTFGGTVEHQNALMHFLTSISSQTFLDSYWFFGIISFFSMALFGILFGSLLGFLASKLLEIVRGETYLELSLTVIVAHATFLLAELCNHYILPVSPVIATTLAAIVLGNYGRNKMSREVAEMMEHLWGFFAHKANSLVFLLVGILFITLDIDWTTLLLPIIICVFVVMISRALSVYPLISFLNYTKYERYIPLQWQHLLAWGSLRGALAIIMILLIPEHIQLAQGVGMRDFLLGLTVGCIVFTVFIKATTITPLMKRFSLTSLSQNENIEVLEGRALIAIESIEKIDRIFLKGYIDETEKEKLHEKNNEELKQVHTLFSHLFQSSDDLNDQIEKIATLHALGIERHSLSELFYRSEISEQSYRDLAGRIEQQLSRIEQGLPQIKTLEEREDQKEDLGIFSILLTSLLNHTDIQENPLHERYSKFRIRTIVTQKVLSGLQRIGKIPFISESNGFQKVVTLYTSLHENALQMRNEVYHENINILRDFDIQMVQRSLDSTALQITEGFIHQELLPSKIAKLSYEHRFSESI